MGFAFITMDNQIRLTMNKISPFEQILPGERIAAYNMPEHDSELETVSPVTPVIGDTVQFSISPTPNQLEVVKKRKSKVIQDWLDTKARERGYDSILSAVSYSTDTLGPFYAESLVYSRWRSDCWAAGYQILANVEVGLIPLPSDAELILMLPALVF